VSGTIAVMGMGPVGTSMAVVSRPAGVLSATSNRSTVTTLYLGSCFVGIIENRLLAGQPHDPRRLLKTSASLSCSFGLFCLSG
jgi:hypothetical protein